MKKLINITVSLLLVSTIAYSQNAVDALRYSQTFYGGSARAMSMGGAFGAFGGDFSCLSYNPAGIAIYRHSELTITPTFYYNKTNSNFLGNNMSDYEYNFNLNNLGFVISCKTGEDKTGWVNTNFAFGYNRTNNFHRNIIIEGVNPSSSMTDYFANRAAGTSPDNLFSGYSQFEEGLAWDAYLINPDTTVTGNVYETALLKYGEVQRKSINSDGYMGEYLFSLGANYSHKFYLGATLGIQNLRYVENSTHTEIGNDTDTIFDSFSFIQHLKTRGTGFNFKIGAIFRPIDWLRIGAAIHTPTFYDLEDNYHNEIESSFDNGDEYNFKSPQGNYKYELTTPFKAMGSIGFVIYKTALIGIDYEFIDYSIARLRASDYDFIDENSSIQTNYRATNNIRAGFEYRFGPFSLRGGYALYGSPYETSQNAESQTIGGYDFYLVSYSAGFGIREDNFFFDLAYVYSKYGEKYYLYEHALLEPANVNFNASKILTTFGIRF